MVSTPFRRQRTVITGLQRSNALASPPDRADRSRQLVFAEQVVMPATPAIAPRWCESWLNWHADPPIGTC